MHTESSVRVLVVAMVVMLALVSAGCRSASEQTLEVPVPTSVAPTAVPAESAEVPADPTAVPVPAEPEAVPTADAVASGNRIGAGDYTVVLDHDGRERSYIMHVPSTAQASAPVVIALHGGGGTGAQFQEENGLDQVADREGFIAVYPEGTGLLPRRLHTWNSGDSCCGYSLDNNIDDVDFLRQVVADLATRVDIDAGRIYMTGHSNGAMMAYRFAVEAAELVTAIVPVGGALDYSVERPSSPVAMLHIHSLDDPRALYEGGEGPPFPGTDRTVNHEPVLRGVRLWAAINECDPAAINGEVLIGDGANEGHRAERMVWQDCSDNATVEHLVLSGSGHGWPGVTSGPLVQRHLGPPTTLINASEELWAFASRFSR